MNATVTSLKTGTKVEGLYMGEPFRGTVQIARYHTINPRFIVVHVDLDEPTVLLGLERDSVALELDIGSGTDGYGSRLNAEENSDA